MHDRKPIGALILVAACSYDFGGGDDAGTGASLATSSSTGEEAQGSSAVTSTSGTESATVASTDSSSSADASSSSTGVVDVTPCKIFDSSTDFVESFDDDEAEDRWSASPDEMSAYVDDFDGTAQLWLRSDDLAAFTANARVAFENCYIEVQQTDPSSHQMDVVSIAKDDKHYFELGFLSDDVDPGTVIELRWGMGAVMVQSMTLPGKRAPFVRLAAEGDKVRAYLREDATPWEQVFEGNRQPWMDEGLKFSFQVRRRDTQEGQNDFNAGLNFDNVNNLP